ncbi:MAG: T9SS type A sorting domain-containing protein [Bacteroidetes bacterium]|nr:T9SS type A sorting domain-containing protein [Bacteroidota bacterium]
MAGFSPDGKKYASFHAEYTTVGGLDIFDFDRCSGMFNNPIHIIIPQSSGFSGGMAFSPNSRFLYTANIESVYQFDMDASNIPSSQTTVAIWDGFYSPSPPFGTYFEMMQLAPDGKIYISTGNSTFHMHVINQPDSLGLACDLAQHTIQFQYFYSNGLPNHPNYFIGCDTTSSCTCLTTGINSPQSHEELQIKSYPNPTTGNFTIQFNVQDAPGEMEIYDVLGNCILKDYISPWSQFKQVNITAFPSGIYFVKMKWKSGVAGVKVVKE